MSTVTNNNVGAWVSPQSNIIHHHPRRTTFATTTTTTWASSSFPPDESDIINADFEKVYSDPYDDDDDQQDEDKDPYDDEDSKTKKKAKPTNLLELSFETGDPRWKELRIPFCRTGSGSGGFDEYIDGKLAFMVELEGTQYGIAVPYDDAVAIVQQSQAGQQVDYVNPDMPSEDGQELMEIMAAQVQQNLGEELTLRKTPKVLTISGGLSKLTQDWEQKLLMPKPATPDELWGVDNNNKNDKQNDGDDDKELAEFLDFMKKELGQEEFDKTMNGNEPLSEEDQELVKFFNIPGLGDQADDVDGLERILQSMVDEDLPSVSKSNDDDDDEGIILPEAYAFRPNMDGAALKLISFEMDKGQKSYTLVKLLQPYILVGKYLGGGGGTSNNSNNDEEPRPEDLQFELLTPEEEQLVIPAIENLYQNEMKTAGLDNFFTFSK